MDVQAFFGRNGHPKDFYAALGLDRHATDQMIRDTYRRLAKIYHPDKPNGSSEKFREIDEAYKVLSCHRPDYHMFYLTVVLAHKRKLEQEKSKRQYPRYPYGRAAWA